MRVEVRSMKNLNTVSTSQIFLDTKQDCAHMENQRERKELVMDEAAKELTAGYSRKMQSDNNSNDVMPTIFVVQSKDTVQSCENESDHHEEMRNFSEKLCSPCLFLCTLFIFLVFYFFYFFYVILLIIRKVFISENGQ